MVSANQEMVVYCFDALVAHYNSDQVLPPDFEEGLHPLFVTWKKVVNGSEPRLRGCIGTSSCIDQWFQGLCSNKCSTRQAFSTNSTQGIAALGMHSFYSN